MHARKKEPKDESKEKLKLEKARKFHAASLKCLEMKKNGCKDRSILRKIGDILTTCPDFATFWNYRKEILIEFKKEVDREAAKDEPKVEIAEDGDSKMEENKDQASENDNQESKVEEPKKELSEEFNELCVHELLLTQNCLKVNPKSYGTWHHRRWLIGFMNNPNLKNEIELCNAFLMMDKRNFHCWNYRRFVINLANVGIHDELNFSLEKIEQDFSNFSSWYYRSNLLSKLYDTGYDREKLQSMIDEDYKRVEEAIYTDPTDQSVWFYLRWLCKAYSDNLKSLSRQTKKALQLNRFYWIVTDKMALVAVEFNDFIKDEPKLTLQVNNQVIPLNDWCSLNNGSIWYSTLPWAEQFQGSFTFQLDFQMNLPSVNTVFTKTTPEQELYFIYNQCPQSKKSIKIDKEKYDTLKQLLDLEPDNKWVNYILACLDSNDDVLNTTIDNLIKMDPLRLNYYNDLRSKTVLKNKLSSDVDLYSNRHLSLAKLNLHSLCDLSQLIHIRYLDLSNNFLVKLGTTFSPLISLEGLILDHNQIRFFDSNLKLPKLKLLSLKNNKLKNETVLEIGNSFGQLRHLCLIGNLINSDIKLELNNSDVNVYIDSAEENDVRNLIESELEMVKKHNTCLYNRK